MGRARVTLTLTLALTVAASVATPAQGPAPVPPDLIVTRLQGGVRPPQIPPTGPGELTPLPMTKLDDRVAAADLDGPRRVSLTLARPLPLRDMLLLLVNGTPLSIVTDETVEGTFVGDLKDLTMRQALEAVLFPRGLDYDVQGTLIRVFPRKAATRLFDVNYLNLRRSWQRTVRSGTSGSTSAEVVTSGASDFFDELNRGVRSLLSDTGRAHVDRTAGLLQVTDFSDRLDQVGVYVEAVQLRATRQVRIDARVLRVTLNDAATAIDWKAVTARTGTAPRPAGGRASSGLRVADFEMLRAALSEQGAVAVLAAPHIVAMNNEPAVMRVGTQGIYFQTASQADGDRTGRSSSATAMLEGLTLIVTAQIAADGIVQLNVAPTYAEKTGQSKSASGDVWPTLQVSEADTLVRVQDGETIVLSGFLDERVKSAPSSGLAGLFGGQARTHEKSELVILLTPAVVMAGAEGLADGR